jgi:hypothetical protein
MPAKALPIVALSCLLFAISAAKHGCAEEVQWNAKAADNEGSFLIVMVPATTTADDLAVRVVVANRGEQVFYCGENGYLPECVIELVGSDGKTLPCTNHGKNLFALEGNGGGQRGERTYKRGFTMFWEFKLAPAFQPGVIKPGKYTMSLRLRTLFTPPRSKSSKGTPRKLMIEGLTVQVK